MTTTMTRTLDQATQIQILLDRNPEAQKEEYKDLKIFTYTNSKGQPCYNVWRAKQGNPIARYYSTSEIQRSKAIDEMKRNADMRQQYKAESKANRTMSEHAKAAKAIREELKKSFPKTKFSVTSESFSMGNAVRVEYTDGPSRKEVEAITDKYQYGHFNGMEDIYENSNSREDIPQAKFVQVTRNLSDKAKDQLHDEFDIDACDERENNDRVYRESIKTSFDASGNMVSDMGDPESVVMIVVKDQSENTYTELFDNLIS